MKLAEELISNHRRFMQDLVSAQREARLSQETVAERMGVSQSAVSQFEHYDSNPTLSTIRRYALAVGVGLRDDVLHSHTETSWHALALSKPEQVYLPPRPRPRGI